MSLYMCLNEYVSTLRKLRTQFIRTNIQEKPFITRTMFSSDALPMFLYN